MICNFYLSAAARIAVLTDTSLRYTSALLGRQATNQQIVQSLQNPYSSLRALSRHRTVHSSVWRCDCLSVCLSVSVCLPIYLSASAAVVCLCVCLSLSPSLFLFMYICFCLSSFSLFLFLSASVCLSVSVSLAL